MSIQKEVYFNLFNEKLDEFFIDIIIAFPKINEFSKFKVGLTMLKNINPKSPQNIFNNYIIPKYRNAILIRDERFFLDITDFDINSKRRDYWIDFINQLKLIWQTIDDNNKDIIWKYFNILLILNDKCINV